MGLTNSRMNGAILWWRKTKKIGVDKENWSCNVVNQRISALFGKKSTEDQELT